VPGEPPLESAHVNACVFSPGGVGGVIGAGEITGPVLPFEAGACEIAAAGADTVLHAASTTASAARDAHPVKSLISRGPLEAARTGE